MRLMKPEALTPCCSSIGSVPESIPAGGSAEVAVKLRPGYQTGMKRVQFVIPTDRVDEPVITLSLSATLTPALEVDFDEPAATTFAVGKPGTLKGRVTCRRKGEQGFDAPSSVFIEPPAIARFVGTAEERQLADGIRQSVQAVEIDFPPSREPGTRSADLRLTWGAQHHDDRRPIVWAVTPALRVTPPAIGLKRSETDSVSREVVIRSTGTPFRVLKVEGKALAPGLRLPEDAATTHRLDLPLDRAALGISDLRIVTDHPDQPIAKLSVWIQSANTAAEGRTPP